MTSVATNIASTIQSASLNRHPSPAHDLNPSTAASAKQPVSPISSISSGDDSIAYSALKPVPRRSNLPPLPDLRFEQSYLASLREVEGWRGIIWVTWRDQVLSPLVQGMLWNLALVGWRYWNQSAEFSGASVGSRVRRWWWKVNNWEVPKND